MSILVTVEDWFDFLARSELIDADTLTAWRDRAWDQHTMGSGVAAIMVDAGLLTRWQADKLLAGKFRGFLLDHYCLTGFVGIDEVKQVSCFQATDRRNNAQVTLEVVPRTRGVRDDGAPIYSVRSAE